MFRRPDAISLQKVTTQIQIYLQKASAICGLSTSSGSLRAIGKHLWHLSAAEAAAVGGDARAWI